MKLHRHLCSSTLEIAKSVLVNHRVLDHELAAAFEANPKWGKRDRNFVAESLFETTRWRRALECLRDRAARPAGRTTPPTDPDERN